MNWGGQAAIQQEKDAVKVASEELVKWSLVNEECSSPTFYQQPWEESRQCVWPGCVGHWETRLNYRQSLLSLSWHKYSCPTHGPHSLTIIQDSRNKEFPMQASISNFCTVATKHMTKANQGKNALFWLNSFRGLSHHSWEVIKSGDRGWLITLHLHCMNWRWGCAVKSQGLSLVTSSEVQPPKRSITFLNNVLSWRTVAWKSHMFTSGVREWGSIGYEWVKGRNKEMDLHTMKQIQWQRFKLG